MHTCTKTKTQAHTQLSKWKRGTEQENWYKCVNSPVVGCWPKQVFEVIKVADDLFCEAGHKNVVVPILSDWQVCFWGVQQILNLSAQMKQATSEPVSKDWDEEFPTNSESVTTVISHKNQFLNSYHQWNKEPWTYHNKNIQFPFLFIQCDLN